MYAVADRGTPQHEAVHAYCGQNFGRTGPVWYSEGMAEMGQYWRVGESRVHCHPQAVKFLRRSKPKTLNTRLGQITLAAPQVRGGVDFYPSALERGARSERALTLAIAQMYVQGVSTRRVTAVLEKLCGLEISSSQVSRAAAASTRRFIPTSLWMAMA